MIPNLMNIKLFYFNEERKLVVTKCKLVAVFV